MGRIRTIKPEFPQSESMGKISRDARLLFLQLWTLVDDSGRTRGNSRMLASLLYPYDEDAGRLIDGWLAELDREACIVRYAVEGQTYLEVCNFSQHQKIDRPTPSKHPSPREGSRVITEPSRKIALDQGRDQGREGIKEGRGEDAQAREELPPPEAEPTFQPEGGRSFRDSPSPGRERLPGIIEAWNSHGSLPKYRQLPHNMPNVGAVLERLRQWDDAEIHEAFRLYAVAYGNLGDYESGTCCWPTLPAFLAGKGMDRFNRQARPLEVYRKKPQEARQDKAAVIAAALAAAGVGDDG